jgi:hypothetical protein
LSKLGAIALAGCCLVAGVAGPGVLVSGGDDAQAAKKRTRLSASITSGSQRRILSKRRIAIRVRSSKAGRFRLFASARRRSGKRRPRVVVTRTRTVRLAAGRRQTVRLRLVRSGRREVSDCRPRRLIANVVPLRGKRPGKAIRRSRKLRRNTLACRPKGTAPAPGEPPDQKPVDYDAPNADRCDHIDQAVCLFPWPNDHFTVADSTTDTGRLLDLQTASMPTNSGGKPIDPAAINRNDGFSPGALIVTKVPGLETQKAFEATGAVPITRMSRAFAADQPVVVLNARTKERHMVWAEIDSSAHSADDVTLLIRPGVNFDEGERYIVALRNLKGEDGKTLEAPQGFRLYRDRVLTTNKEVEARRGHFESLFTTLATAGIDRDSLYRAWDFTVASERNLTERVLTIRDDAFKRLGDTNLADLKVEGTAPEFEIEEVTVDPEEQLALRVEGRYTVPCYLNLPDCASGATFSYPAGSKHGPPSIPAGSTTTARFQCNVPKSATTPGASRPSLYGHGLLGSRGEVNQGQLRDFGLEHNFIFCATDWIGMSCADLPDTDPSPDAVATFLEKAARNQLPNCDYQTVVSILEDMSNFPKLADRVQQGLVNFLYLGRLMVHPDGFSKDPNFQKDGQSLIDTRRLFYDGNSQGGIIGGALAAVGVDHDRAVLGVPGMNYSTLLTRSTDWGTGQQPSEADLPEYSWFMYEAYPNELERQLIFSLIQTLWDRAEANGYAHHMTSDPLPNTPPHQVMLHAGLGDHQVAQITAEVEARTMGASTHTPYVDPGRDSDVAPHYAIPGIPASAFPFTGSALILWDIGPKRTEGEETVGTEVPPTTNTPPGEAAGQDPHEFPRRSKIGRQQKSAFLSIGGQVIEVCGARPCYAGTWTGP